MTLPPIGARVQRTRKFLKSIGCGVTDPVGDGTRE